MEHRFSPRKGTNSPVMIYQNQIGFITASVKNVSANGMLVDTGRFALPKGSIVELAGAASWKLESKRGLPKALIIHAADGLTGLMLIANRGKVADLWGNSQSERTEEAAPLVSRMDGALENGNFNRALEYASSRDQ
jgi:hypothetical protein